MRERGRLQAKEKSEIILRNYIKEIDAVHFHTQGKKNDCKNVVRLKIKMSFKNICNCMGSKLNCLGVVHNIACYCNSFCPVSRVIEREMCSGVNVQKKYRK